MQSILAKGEERLQDRKSTKQLSKISEKKDHDFTEGIPMKAEQLEDKRDSLDQPCDDAVTYVFER